MSGLGADQCQLVFASFISLRNCQFEGGLIALAGYYIGLMDVNYITVVTFVNVLKYVSMTAGSRFFPKN